MKDYPEQYVDFISEARERGLVGATPWELPLRFYVNQGDISLPDDLDKLESFLRLGWEKCPTLVRIVLGKTTSAENREKYSAGSRVYLPFDNDLREMPFRMWLLDRGIDESLLTNE